MIYGLAERLQELRLSRRLSQKEVAHLICEGHMGGTFPRAAQNGYHFRNDVTRPYARNRAAHVKQALATEDGRHTPQAG